MRRIIVAGIGTDVGKTVVSAILITLFQADYWKPIQCGDEENSDTEMMRRLIDPVKHQIHPPVYSFKAPLSPHHAARLENRTISLDIDPPRTTRPLIIEAVGGVYVPLRMDILTIDLFKRWNAEWVLVSKHYLGSINHTLLTIDVLKQYNISIAGIIFNGEPNPDSESAILQISKLPVLGQLHREQNINQHTIQRLAKQWHQF